MSFAYLFPASTESKEISFRLSQVKNRIITKKIIKNVEYRTKYT